MKSDVEKYGFATEEITDEGVDFHNLQAESEDDETEDVLESIDPKFQESLKSVIIGILILKSAAFITVFETPACSAPITSAKFMPV